MRLFAATLVCYLLMPSSATAQVRLGAGFDVGYLVGGDSSVRGRKANPTGGLTAIGTVRVLVASPSPYLDAAYVQAPMAIAPFDPDRAGFIDANDIGVALHPADRSWNVLVAGTVGPAYALYCNVKWCLREWVPVGGGALRAVGNVLQSKDGTGLHVDLSARVLYAQPTAWTWPQLTAEERAILPLSWMVNGGAHWSW